MLAQHGQERCPGFTPQGFAHLKFSSAVSIACGVQIADMGIQRAARAHHQGIAVYFVPDPGFHHQLHIAVEHCEIPAELIRTPALELPGILPLHHGVEWIAALAFPGIIYNAGHDRFHPVGGEVLGIAL